MYNAIYANPFTNMQVFVRIRPLQDSEKRDDSLKWTDNQIQLSQSPSGAAAQSYTLGQVLEPGSTQDDMMNRALLHSVASQGTIMIHMCMHQLHPTPYEHANIYSRTCQEAHTPES